MYDVFLSYARADVDRVKRIERALVAAGLRVFRDAQEVNDFESITDSLIHGLANSKVLLAFYSRTYPSRRACQWELTAAFLAALAATGGPVRRILVINPERTFEHIEPVELQDAKYWCARELAGTAYDDAELQVLALAIKRRVESLSTPIGSALSRPRWHGWQGLGSNRFVGRTRYLWKLHSALRAADVGLITGQVAPGHAQVRGMVGTGKSLLVEEYALRFGGAYPGGIFWLNAHGNDYEGNQIDQAQFQSDLEGQLSAIAESLGVNVTGASGDEAQQALAVTLHRNAANYLWIVDDLPSGVGESACRRWIAPNPGIGRTIITTRDRSRGGVGGVLDLECLDADSAYELLTSRHTPIDSDDEREARTLAAELGHHALAIDVTGGAMEALGGAETYASYRKLLANPDTDILDIAGALAGDLPNGHDKNIAATLVRSIKLLNVASLDFLRLAAMLASDAIPAGLINEVISGMTEGPEPLAGAVAAAQAAKRSLAESVRVGGGAWSVHNLVARTVGRNDGQPERIARIRSVAVKSLIQALSRLEDERQLPALASEARHAYCIAEAATSEDEVRLLAWVARYYHLHGKYSFAETIARKVLACGKNFWGDGSLETTAAKASLAAILTANEKHYEAFHIENNVIFERRRQLIVGDRTSIERLLQALHNAATSHSKLGSFHSALQLEMEVQSHVGSLGEEHPLILSSQSQLGYIAFHQGDYEFAEKIQRRLLEIRVQSGEDHPSALRSMHNLASALEAKGELVAARELLERAIELGTPILGEEHPDTLIRRRYLDAIIAAQELE
jgi:tetratricopeptide (TPR) repeat protein